MSEPAFGVWLPIETAPKDDTDVLLYAAAWDWSWGIQIGRFSGGQWHTAEGCVDENDPSFDADAEVEDEFGDLDCDDNTGPTHWMRLPSPPGKTP